MSSTKTVEKPASQIDCALKVQCAAGCGEIAEYRLSNSTCKAPIDMCAKHYSTVKHVWKSLGLPKTVFGKMKDGLVYETIEPVMGLLADQPKHQFIASGASAFRKECDSGNCKDKAEWHVYNHDRPEKYISFCDDHFNATQFVLDEFSLPHQVGAKVGGAKQVLIMMTLYIGSPAPSPASSPVSSPAKKSDGKKAWADQPEEDAKVKPADKPAEKKKSGWATPPKVGSKPLPKKPAQTAEVDKKKVEEAPKKSENGTSGKPIEETYCYYGMGCTKGDDCERIHVEISELFCKYGTSCTNKNCERKHKCEEGSECVFWHCNRKHPKDRKKLCPINIAGYVCKHFLNHLEEDLTKADEAHCDAYIHMKKNDLSHVRCHGGRDCEDDDCSFAHPADFREMVPKDK